MGAISILVFIVCMVYFQKETHGLTCFSCLGITHPRFCKHVDNCNGGEICGLEKMVYPSGETTFNVGCFQSKTCYDNGTKSSEHDTCRHCCTTDICNDNGCGERGLTHLRGPICYHCDGALSMDECKSILICEQNQFCYIEEQFSFGERFYSTSCQYKNVCDAVSGGFPIVGRKRTAIKILRSSTCSRCCENDLCNTDCWKSNLSGTTTTRTAKSTITIDTTVIATTTTATTTSATTTSKGNPRECSDIQFDKHGVFTIYPKGDLKPKSVYCMILNGVKWTVIQRRFNGSTDFDRTWNAYREGFGDGNTEYWLGNEHIHSLTANGQHKLHIHLEEKDGTVKYADYLSFHVSNEDSKYLLNVTNYSGIAGDCLNIRENRMAFSTKDQDNDSHGTNCAETYSSGWWYNRCYDCNLNEYGGYGPIWRYYLGERLLKATIMMISKV